MDCLGFQFCEQTTTLVIGRHGGKIGLERKLVPQQEVTIRCLATGREAEALIVGQIGKSTGAHYYYGIKFLGGDENIWGIEFPPLTESEGAAGRALLECTGCKNREVICLDDFELEVLEANGCLSLSCKRCRDVSLWRKSREDIPESEMVTSAPSPPLITELPERRREPRREMQVTACVRSTRFGQDLVKVRNISRGGLCFVSPWEYIQGETIEVAVPYSPGGGNIFLPANIVRVQLLVSQGTRIYGIAFQHVKR
jgi:hypothetical protein